MTTRDVFVSYASADRAAADALCARLVSAYDIRSRKAPRETGAAASGPSANVENLERSRVMVFVFRGDENATMAVAREVAHAVKRGITILPLRTDDVMPAGSIGAGAEPPQRPSDLPPALLSRIHRLADAIKALVDEQAGPAPVVAGAARGDAPTEPGPPRARWSGWGAGMAAVAAVVVVAALAFGIRELTTAPSFDTDSDSIRGGATEASMPSLPSPDASQLDSAPLATAGLDAATGAPAAEVPIADRAAPAEPEDPRGPGVTGSSPAGSEPEQARAGQATANPAAGEPIIGPAPTARPGTESAPARAGEAGAASRFGRTPEPAGTSGLTMSGILLIDFINSLSQGTIEVEIDGQLRWSERLKLPKPTGALAALRLQRASEQIGSQLSVPTGDHKVTVTILNGEGEVWDFDTTSLHIEASRPVTLRIRLTRFKNRLRLESATG